MQSESTHEKLSAELMARHEVLRNLIGCAPFHYVDIPVHGNIGDLLIMHGTLAFFRKQGLTPKLIAPYFAYDARWIAPEDVIVFHGGGNFGDLYPYFQELRERIVQSHPENRIIILPQSLHFSTPEKMAQSAEIFRTHADVHLCVRDQVSFEMAQEFSDHVYLLPDMAHQLHPMRAHVLQPGAGSLRISRVDDESSDHSRMLSTVSSTVTDWPQFVGEREAQINLFRRAIGGFFRRGLGRQANRILVPLWMAYSGRLTADAARLFAQHELIVTDRLHGHILACLLNRKNIVLDNSYGKNSRYVEAWTGDSELVMLQKPQSASPVAQASLKLATL